MGRDPLVLAALDEVVSHLPEDERLDALAHLYAHVVSKCLEEPSRYFETQIGLDHVKKSLVVYELADLWYPPSVRNFGGVADFVNEIEVPSPLMNSIIRSAALRLLTYAGSRLSRTSSARKPKFTSPAARILPRTPISWISFVGGRTRASFRHGESVLVD